MVFLFLSLSLFFFFLHHEILFYANDESSSLVGVMEMECINIGAENTSFRFNLESRSVSR